MATTVSIKKPAIFVKLYDFQNRWYKQRLKELNAERRRQGLPRLTQQAYIEQLLVSDGMPTV